MLHGHLPYEKLEAKQLIVRHLARELSEPAIPKATQTQHEVAALYRYFELFTRLYFHGMEVSFLAAQFLKRAQLVRMARPQPELLELTQANKVRFLFGAQILAEHRRALIFIAGRIRPLTFHLGELVFHVVEA